MRRYLLALLRKFASAEVLQCWVEKTAHEGHPSGKSSTSHGIFRTSSSAWSFLISALWCEIVRYFSTYRARDQKFSP
uniref:Putative secreted peptide n=1 Tax=Anopheles braziliensis TaxID=58242 RepID=A0A2M3ZUS1_9DIPT